MKTVYSPLHAGHAGQMELVTSAIVPGFEKPSRAEFIKARVESEKLGPIILPLEHDLELWKKIGYDGYLSVEIFREEYWKQPVDKVVGDAKTAFDKWLGKGN